MMKKLTFIIPALALVLFSTCGRDIAEMDTGLNGRWITLNGSQIYLSGMSFTRTAAVSNSDFGYTGSPDVDTGTFSAAGGYITFIRLGNPSETQAYTLNFPQLKIGDITYYHDSPSEPVDITGTWYRAILEGRALTFYPGKRVRDENKRETLAIEGDYVIHYETKGRYTISNRNLPDNSFVVFAPTHIHVGEIWAFFNLNLTAEETELFDLSLIDYPVTEEGITDWWFTFDEVRRFFEAAAEKATDLEARENVNRNLMRFLSFRNLERVPYYYTVVFDPDITYEGIEMNGPNKITMIENGGYQRRLIYLKWDGVTGLERGDEDDFSSTPLGK
jgi:hypothetical protein